MNNITDVILKGVMSNGRHCKYTPHFRYGDGAVNTIEENSSVFSLMR